MAEMIEKEDPYKELSIVLHEAYVQAAFGKGMQRHASSADEKFEHQAMQKISDLYGPGFCLGQAAKKMHESQGLPKDAAIKELLGAIVYIAGHIISLRRENAS